MRRERVLAGLIVLGTLAGLSCGDGGAASAPAAAKPSAGPARPVKLVAVVGADGHGKSTLLCAVARTLRDPPDGRRRSYEELRLGDGYTVSFDAGDRTVTLREYPSGVSSHCSMGTMGTMGTVPTCNLS